MSEKMTFMEAEEVLRSHGLLALADRLSVVIEWAQNEGLDYLT